MLTYPGVPGLKKKKKRVFSFEKVNLGELLTLIIIKNTTKLKE